MPAATFTTLIAPRSIALSAPPPGPTPLRPAMPPSAIPGDDLAGPSDQSLHAGDHLLSHRSPICRRRPTPHSSRCPITRRRRSPERWPHAAPADSSASASGFSETRHRVRPAARRENSSANAGELPFFGPNCYGFVNFFDRAAMLPDQVVGAPIERGVALICQSGTIALTLSFNERSVPIGCLFSVGNQTRLAVEDLIEMLCDDPRVTAFGLYLEGIKDPERFARAADKARRGGQAHRRDQIGPHGGRGAHGAQPHRRARRRRRGVRGLLPSGRALPAAIRWARCARPSSCSTSGGASGGPQGPDHGRLRRRHGDDGRRGARRGSRFCAGSRRARPRTLQELLTDRVTVANPFDIHTYLWFDPPALKRVFSTAHALGIRCCGLHAGLSAGRQGGCRRRSTPRSMRIIEASHGAPSRVALIASLPETISARVRKHCLDGGVVPLRVSAKRSRPSPLAGGRGHRHGAGSGSALAATAAARRHRRATAHSLERSMRARPRLQQFGVAVPRSSWWLPPRPPQAAPTRWVFPWSSRPSARTWSTRPRSAASCSMCAARRSADAAAAGSAALGHLVGRGDDRRRCRRRFSSA